MMEVEKIAAIQGVFPVFVTPQIRTRSHQRMLRDPPNTERERGQAEATVSYFYCVVFFRPPPPPPPPPLAVYKYRSPVTCQEEEAEWRKPGRERSTIERGREMASERGSPKAHSVFLYSSTLPLSTPTLFPSVSLSTTVLRVNRARGC